MIQSFGKAVPKIEKNVFVAESALILGDVEIGEGSSIWFGAVLRGDCCSIKVGEESNIQDNAVLHADPGGEVYVGCRVTVGHSAVLHGCRISDDVLVGMKAVVMNDAVIGCFSIVGAGALVTEGKRFPEGSLILGVPAKVVRQLTEEEREYIKKSASEYVKLSRSFLRRKLNP